MCESESESECVKVNDVLRIFGPIVLMATASQRINALSLFASASFHLTSFHYESRACVFPPSLSFSLCALLLVRKFRHSCSQGVALTLTAEQPNLMFCIGTQIRLLFIQVF